jgi:hypothetical protein
MQFAPAASQPTASPPDAGALDQSPLQLAKSSPLKSQGEMKSKLLEE